MIIRPLLFGLSLLMMSTPLTLAHAGAKSDRFIIVITRADATVKDCKISIKEIAKFNSVDKKDDKICTSLEVSNSASSLFQEATPTDLNALLVSANQGQGGIAFGYEGADANNLLATATAWLTFLQTQADATTQAKSTGWNVSLVGGDASVAVLQFSGPSETFEITVALNTESSK